MLCRHNFSLWLLLANSSLTLVVKIIALKLNSEAVLYIPFK